MRLSYIIPLIVALFGQIVSAQTVRWVVGPEYEAISPFFEGVAAVKKNGKWGYINEKGSLFVNPEYENVSNFNNGVAVATAADKTVMAIIDLNGKVVKPKGSFKVDNRFACFSDGLLLVTNGSKWGYMNLSGNLSIECKYLSAQPFSENFAAVLFDEYWYYISADGSIAIPPNSKRESYWAFGFNEGKAVILYNNGMTCIDAAGKEINMILPKVTPPADAASYKLNTLSCKEGELLFDFKSRLYGFVDKKGKQIELFNLSDTKQNKTFTEGSFVLDGKTILYADSRILWHAPSLATLQVSSGKYGIVALGEKTVVEANLLSDTIWSVFGNPAEVKLILKNNSEINLEQLNVTLDGSETIIDNLQVNDQKEVMSLLPKQKELLVEDKELTLSLTQYGLLLNKQEKQIVIKDSFPLKVVFTDKVVELKPDEKNYLSFNLLNEASVDAKDLVVLIKLNTETCFTETITIPAKSNYICKFSVDIHQTISKSAEVTLKFQNIQSQSFAETIQFIEKEVKEAAPEGGRIIETSKKILTE